LVAAKEELHRTSTVLTILPDEVAVAAMGINPLDLSTAKPCALAGRAQAAAHVAEVSALWDKGR
jgi:NTE family protein